jgi:hypothetical protein
VPQPVTRPAGTMVPGFFQGFETIKEHLVNCHHLLPRDTWHFYDKILAFVPLWDKILNVSNDMVWHVPSATHAPYIHWSQNKVLSTSVCYIIFSITKTSLSLYIATSCFSKLQWFDHPEDGGSKLL